MMKDTTVSDEIMAVALDLTRKKKTDYNDVGLT